MSNQLLSLVWKNSRATNGARLVALCLADTDRGDAKGVWLSVGSIGKMCGLKERATQAALAQLVKLGELRIVANAGRMGTNVYHLTPPENTPAISAPPQYLHPRNICTPADNAPLPAISAPPQNEHPAVFDTTPPQFSTLPPAISAPDTLMNPKEPLSLPARAQKSDVAAAADAPSERGFAFADWFRTLLKPEMRLTSNWRDQWARCYDDMIRLDGRTPERIASVCRWAREDAFWAQNFQSPLKLRDRNRNKTQYFDVLDEARGATSKPRRNGKAITHTPITAENAI